MAGLVALAVLLWVGGSNPRLAVPGLGADFIHPTTVVLVVVALFYWSHYLFASITSHAVVLLPVVLGIGREIAGLPLGLLALLCIHSLGLMGVLSPYATGCAPIYAGSGFIGRARFWWLGLLFGALYFAVLIGVVGPWLLAIGPAH